MVQLKRAQRAKIEMMTGGVGITDEARALMVEQSGLLTLGEYATTSGVTLVLGEDIYVNAPFTGGKSEFVTNPDNVVAVYGGGLVVENPYEQERLPVRFVPVPAYHVKTNKRGKSLTKIVATHSDRARISPIAGCAMACKFCNIPWEQRYEVTPEEELVDAVGEALADPTLPAQHVLISGGTPRPDDYTYLNKVYNGVAGAFPGVDVDVMMVPAPGLLDAKRLIDAGIHGLSINLEMFNQELAKQTMLSKAKMSRQRYFDFITEATKVFGSEGRVRSLLLVGIEPVEDTLRGVQALSELGCDPVLSPFRPDPSTPMRNVSPPSIDTLVRAFEESAEIVRAYGVELGPRCVPCMHNTLTFPGSGKHYYSRVRQG